MQIKNKKIIITGGAGFIGSNLAQALCDDNELVLIDNLTTGHIENIGGVFERIRFEEGDINDIQMLRREFDSGDFVLHQAALPSVQRSIKDPMTTNYANVGGTLNVLEAARDCGIKRVVFASSSSVYGDTSESIKKESLQPNPMSPYAVTKITCEYYCKVFYNLYGLETVMLRYFNVFGPGQDANSEYSAVIPKFIKKIKNGDRPIIYGDGSQSRDFTYVANVVLANILACGAPNASGKVMNIACGHRTSLKELIGVLGEILGVDISPVYADPKPGDVKHSLADISLAKEILGYFPKYSLRDGLNLMLNKFTRD